MELLSNGSHDKREGCQENGSNLRHTPETTWVSLVQLVAEGRRQALRSDVELTKMQVSGM